CAGAGFIGKNASSTLVLLPNRSGNRLTFRLCACQTFRNDAVRNSRRVMSLCTAACGLAHLGRVDITPDYRKLREGPDAGGPPQGERGHTRPRFAEGSLRPILTSVQNNFAGNRNFIAESGEVASRRVAKVGGLPAGSQPGLAAEFAPA